MTPKEYLLEFQTIRHKRQNYSKMIANIEDECISIGGINYGDKVQSSPQNDPIGNIVIGLINKKASLGLKVAQLRAQELVVENQILAMNEVKPEYSEIIFYRYVSDYGWKAICEAMNVSRTQVNRIHGEALKKMDELFHISTKIGIF